MGVIMSAAFVSSALAGLLSGCQTPRYLEFEQIKIGMTKDQVLSAAGGPNVSERWHGMDRWIYRLADRPEGPLTRELHFVNGVAIYVGPPQAPLVSADETDMKNAIRNYQIDTGKSVESIDAITPTKSTEEPDVQPTKSHFVPID